MFGAIMLIIIVIVACVAVLVGLAIKQRSDKRELSRQEQVTMAKATGAFQHRKSNQ